jgi:hypothetical protein
MLPLPSSTTALSLCTYLHAAPDAAAFIAQRDGAPVLISNESSLLSADDEDRAAALLRQLDFEEALLEALASDLRLSLTPTGTPCKEVRASI